MTAMILPKLGNCKDYYEAEQALLAMGARPCGSGHFSSVFSIEVSTIYNTPMGQEYNPFLMRHEPVMPARIAREVRIIKVTRRKDKGALIVAKAAMACAPIDPLAPKYYGITEFGNGKFMAEMEPLTELTNMEHHAGITGATDEDRKWAAKREPLPEAISKSPFLLLLSHYVGKGYKWDVHKDNVMMRGHQPVISDPMFGSADCY